MEQILVNEKLSCSVSDDHIYINRYGKTFDVYSGELMGDCRVTFISTDVGGRKMICADDENVFNIANAVKAFQSGSKASSGKRMLSPEEFCELVTKKYMQFIARLYAAESMLSLKNNEWLSEGEQPIDTETFMERIRLQGIEPCQNGNLKLWCDAGDMFSGHSIAVRLNPDFTLDHTELL